MAQITSREELEEWLKDKPADWAQVIALRAALRALPYSLLRKKLIDVKINHANIVFREAIGVFTKFTHIVRNEGAHQSVARKFLVRAAHELHDIPEGTTFSLEVAALTSLRAFSAAIQLPDTVVHDYTVIAYSACVAFDDPQYAWRAVGADIEWMHSRATPNPLNRLDTSELWHVAQPSNLALMMRSIQSRLLTLDPTYQVWIDWYNRRIEGHDAAFDIPGDSDRIHDKAILARLADATDEDFWGKGATYVNTTLQRWIDEARIDARIDAVAAKLRGGAIPRYGTPEALAARAALVQELDRLLTEPSDPRLKIGGNQPPEEIDPEERPVALPPAIREHIVAIKAELQVPEPDTFKIVEKSKLVLRLIKWREDIADVTGEHFAQGYGEEFGKLVAGDIHKLLRVAIMGLLGLIAAFLALVLGLVF